MDGKKRLEKLLEYVSTNGRVCPMPIYWSNFHKIISEEKECPDYPVVLGVWYDSGSLVKMLCLKSQIEFAYNNGVFDKAEKYLLSLTKSQWAYGNGEETIDEYNARN